LKGLQDATINACLFGHLAVKAARLNPATGAPKDTVGPEAGAAELVPKANDAVALITAQAGVAANPAAPPNPTVPPNPAGAANPAEPNPEVAPNAPPVGMVL